MFWEETTRQKWKFMRWFKNDQQVTIEELGLIAEVKESPLVWGTGNITKFLKETMGFLESQKL